LPNRLMAPREALFVSWHLEKLYLVKGQPILIVANCFKVGSMPCYDRVLHGYLLAIWKLEFDIEALSTCPLPLSSMLATDKAPELAYQF
jgi:hypothetical protein